MVYSILPMIDLMLHYPADLQRVVWMRIVWIMKLCKGHLISLMSLPIDSEITLM